MRCSEDEIRQAIEEQLGDVGPTKGAFLMMPPKGCSLERFMRICRKEYKLSPQPLVHAAKTSRTRTTRQ